MIAKCRGATARLYARHWRNSRLLTARGWGTTGAGRSRSHRRGARVSAWRAQGRTRRGAPRIFLTVWRRPASYSGCKSSDDISRGPCGLKPFASPKKFDFRDLRAFVLQGPLERVTQAIEHQRRSAFDIQHESDGPTLEFQPEQRPARRIAHHLMTRRGLAARCRGLEQLRDTPLRAAADWTRRARGRGR